MTRSLPVWDPVDDDAFVCVAVRRITPTATALVLAPRIAAQVQFEAGQYVTIEFELGGTTVQRCYTVSSPPTRARRIEITVGHRPGGVVSPHVAEGITVGSQVRVGPFQGSFTMQAHPAGSSLLLSAGSGITPALSMLRELYDLGQAHDVVMVHAQRRPGEIAFRDELGWIARCVPGVRVHFVCSEAPSAEDVPDDGTVVRGRVDEPLLTALVPDLAAREIFVCGPTGFRADMCAALARAGCDPARVHEETFTFADAGDVRDVPDVPTAAPAEGHVVEFRDLGVQIVCPPQSTVLMAATAAGLEMPSSCGEGLCGTCKHTLVAGEVDMQHAGGIRPREIAAGKFLPCCSRPLTDLVIGA